MLPEVTSGELEVRHIVTPIRTQLRRTQFVLSEVLEIDVDAPHDPLRARADRRNAKRSSTIISCSRSVRPRRPSDCRASPNASSRSRRSKTRRACAIVWSGCSNSPTRSDDAYRRRLLTLVVVGGGFTGVETAGEIFELFRSVLRFYPQHRQARVKMVLVEAGPTLLPGLPPKMGSTRAESSSDAASRFCSATACAAPMTADFSCRAGGASRRRRSSGAPASRRRRRSRSSACRTRNAVR